MKPNLALRAACCALIGLAGCTNLPNAKDYSTALGEPQSQLQQDPNWSGGRIWVRPGPPIGSQFDKKLLMEPTFRATGRTSWTSVTTPRCASACWPT